MADSETTADAPLDPDIAAEMARTCNEGRALGLALAQIRRDIHRLAAAVRDLADEARKARE